MDGQIEVKPIVDTIAKRIRERRRTLGLTQEKLAERAGLSVNYLAQLEISDKTPSLKTLAALAHALETDVSDLFASSPQGRWQDEAQNILRSLECMKDSDVRFVFAQMQAAINYLKWERDRNNQEN